MSPSASSKLYRGFFRFLEIMKKVFHHFKHLPGARLERPKILSCPSHNYISDSVAWLQSSKTFLYLLVVRGACDILVSQE